MTIQNNANYSFDTGYENGAMCVWFENKEVIEKALNIDYLINLMKKGVKTYKMIVE